MKFDMVKYLVTGLVSHPARGAWIEIILEHVASIDGKSRTPQGVRGLKSVNGKDAAYIA